MNQAVHSPRRTRNSKSEGRTNDPQRTIADIIEVATREFAENGLAGARIDVIAEAMRTSKRMIYGDEACKGRAMWRVFNQSLADAPTVSNGVIGVSSTA